MITDIYQTIQDLPIYQFLILNLQLSSGGGRLIIASDGVWDALTAEVALECSRGMQPDAAASQIVKVYAYNIILSLSYFLYGSRPLSKLYTWFQQFTPTYRKL